MNVLGGCNKELQWTYDEEGCVIVPIKNCATGEMLKICPPDPDRFVTGEVEGDTLTLSNINGEEGEVEICLTQVKGAVIVAADGTETQVEISEEGFLQFPEEESLCWGLDDDGCPVITGIKNCVTGEAFRVDAVQEITGNVVDNTEPKKPVVTAVASVSGNSVDNSNPQNPTIASSSTAASPAGFHTITTADGEETPVCLEPVKDVLDPLGLSIVTEGVAQLVDYLKITESPDGTQGTVTNTLTGDSCTFLKQVDIPADVFVESYDMQTVNNPDGSTSYQFTITMSNDTVLPAGPVIDMDKFGSVVDNGNGTGSVTDPVTSLICTFQKPIVDSEGNPLPLSGPNGEPQLPSPPDVPEQVAEWSTSIVVPDGGATPTAPTEPDTCSKVLNAAGNLIGTVDGDGYHPIVHPTEWSTSIVVPDGGATPTAPTEPGTCSKVLDDAGNLIGIVDGDGYHPIVHPANPYPIVAGDAGTDFFGDSFEAGDRLIEWPPNADGEVLQVCIPVKGSPEPVLEKRCGTLAEVYLTPVAVQTGNPITSASGSTYNMDYTAEYRTAGGTLIATAVQTTTVTGTFHGYESNPNSLDPGGPLGLIYYNRDGENRLGIRLDDPGGNGGGPNDDSQMGFNVRFVEESDGSVEGCPGDARTVVALRDVDNNSVTSNHNRLWDNIDFPFGSSGTVTESPAGTFSWPPGHNAYLEWTAALSDEDEVSLDYLQDATDGLVMWAAVYYTPAVCYYVDEAGTIVEAETIDGPMDPADFGSIIV